ncbi:MAG TPA: ParA family protein [Phenylobacterium sp.]|uniref:ParA family protein n=1 Tax=Phenylobacterium sp. TaxID=1871053 RepID=UPI002B4A31E0|nr:ParA family protein [Phenylobacterium sp.]HKR88400.1 ParA family protein [Phenylobacterium sp.]
MKTLAVLSRKGGAGKTTVSLSVALAARQAGLRVVVADVDPLHSAAEVMRTRPEASSMLFETTASKLFIVQDACRQNGCDLLVIDTPAAPDADVLRAANVADLCLAVARPTSLDVAAVRESITLIRRAGHPGLVVLNQCPPTRGGEESDVVVQALERLRFGHLPIASTKLRSRIAYQRAFAHNCAVTEWDPASEAAAEVLRLLAEISDQMTLAPAGPAPPREARSGPGPVHLMRAALKRLA